MEEERMAAEKRGRTAEEGKKESVKVLDPKELLGEHGVSPKMLAGFLGIDEKDVVSKRSVETAEKLSLYERYRESGEILSGMRFSQLEKKTGMWFWDGDIKVLMPATEHMCYRLEDPEKAFVTERFLGRPYNVKVIGVDRDRKVVRVSYYEAQETVRGAFEKAINESLEKGTPYVTKAIVNNVETLYDFKGDVVRQYKLQLSVGGVGTNGYLWIEDWSESFTPSFEGVVKKGDVIDVAVTEKLKDPRTTYKNHEGYRCSRKLVEHSPWIGLEDRIGLRDVVDVICAEPPNDRHRNYFWGSIPGIEGLFFPCFLPKGSGMYVYKGFSYRGVVTGFSPDERILRILIRDPGDEN